MENVVIPQRWRQRELGWVGGGGVSELKSKTKTVTKNPMRPTATTKLHVRHTRHQSLHYVNVTIIMFLQLFFLH